MEQGRETLTRLIKEYIDKTAGRITYQLVDSELDIKTPTEKGLRRGVFKELADKGTLRKDEKYDGVYWRIDKEAPEIDWQSADPKNVIKLKFPFGLEKYVKIFPKSIIILAGEKESCKTQWLYELALMNMYHPLGLDLYNSETGKEQMKERLDNFDYEIPTPPPFRTFERYDNFADVIDANRISVIDYLDLTKDVFLVGEEIDRMFRKLRGGAVFAGIQIPPPVKVWVRGVEKWQHRDLGYGAGATVKRAILYLVLWSTGGNTKLFKIKHCKTRADPKIDPNNMQWTFRVNGTGTKFLEVKRVGEELFNFEDEL